MEQLSDAELSEWVEKEAKRLEALYRKWFDLEGDVLEEKVRETINRSLRNMNLLKD